MATSVIRVMIVLVIDRDVTHAIPRVVQTVRASSGKLLASEIRAMMESVMNRNDGDGSRSYTCDPNGETSIEQTSGVGDGSRRYIWFIVGERFRDR